ncbi:hypothetical protein [Azohydromonas lata]|uniref:hypothetical protein n=1 Tax=Azohydromonas lata TaxID=45677 RepID=UPI0012F49731|nr:hypothetical protein [Azohydromonas lata]
MSNLQLESCRSTIYIRPLAAGSAMLCAAGLAAGLAALPAAAAPGEQGMGAGVRSESTDTYYVYPGRPRVWLSRHGNLTRFEGPAGYDHIGGGTVGEGYVLCYNSRIAYDVGYTESGFGTSTASCSGSTCTVTRTTTDGLFRLRQVISKDTVQRAVTIEMTLTKLGQTTASNVTLRRQVDFDVDASGSLGSNNFTSWFGATERESAFAWNPANYTANEGHMIMLRHLERVPSYVPYTAKVTFSILDTSCNPTNAAAYGPVEGDYGATIQYNVGSMGQGAVFTGRVQYLRN